jgi:glycosyltransferase involved in cell wall biosynthesis
MSTRFSVLIPAYNRESYVRACVDSVLAQTFKSYEIIVINDGSTDGTKEVLESYGTRITAIHQANSGPEVARNGAAAIAQGEYLVMLDSDDLLFPNTLEVVDRAIQQFDRPPLLLGTVTTFEDGEGLPAVPDAETAEVFRFKDYFSKTVQLGTNLIVIKRSTFHEVGGLRNTTPETFHADDIYLLMKAGTASPCIVIEKPATRAYRQHSDNSVKNAEAISNGLIRLAHAEDRGEFPGGSARWMDRYVCLGGRAGSWAYLHCWKQGHYRVALRLLLETAPMILTATLVKMLAPFRKAPAAAAIRAEDHVSAYQS